MTLRNVPRNTDRPTFDEMPVRSVRVEPGSAVRWVHNHDGDPVQTKIPAVRITFSYGTQTRTVVVPRDVAAFMAEAISAFVNR